ncbi:sirohydrochlorin chelatase [Streptomyces paromomycinus]|uniref:sirohydrochlorin chelatase n=1 Tax=Streptomyces paromomycinus TaxID=92743 RepID=UPI000F6203FC|nr:CbiX/SirB N-terminal domain-containing protein [Streptomyces paromomycinus]
MASFSPVLIAAAHGSHEARAQTETHRLLAHVRALRPALRVDIAFFDIHRPTVDEAVAALHGTPATVVPLLLGTGFHFSVDLPALLGHARAARPLAPHPLLVDALLHRLREAESHAGFPADAVVLAAAGSRRPGGNDSCRTAARDLGAALCARRGSPVPVRPAVLCDGAADGPSLARTAADLRAEGRTRIAVLPYLMAPGRFFDRLAAEAGRAECVITARPLGAQDAMARLVLARFDACARPATTEHGMGARVARWGVPGVSDTAGRR